MIKIKDIFKENTKYEKNIILNFPAVYFLHNKNDKIIYIGSTTKLLSRISNHHIKNFSYFTFKKSTTKSLIKDETKYILKYQPKYNYSLPHIKGITTIDTFITRNKTLNKPFKTILKKTILKQLTPELSIGKYIYFNLEEVNKIRKELTARNEDIQTRINSEVKRLTNNGYITLRDFILEHQDMQIYTIDFIKTIKPIYIFKSPRTKRRKMLKIIRLYSKQELLSFMKSIKKHR